MGQIWLVSLLEVTTIVDKDNVDLTIQKLTLLGGGLMPRSFPISVHLLASL